VALTTVFGIQLRVNRNGRTEYWDPKVLDNGGILSETTSDKLRAQEAAKRAEKSDIDAPKPKRAAAKAALASMSDIIEVETPKVCLCSEMYTLMDRII
jgi:hypothetical protein